MSYPFFSAYRNAFRGLSRPVWYLSFVMLVNRSGTMVVPFMTMYLTQHLGVSLGKAGWVMAFFGLGAVAGSLIGGKLTDKIGFYPVQLTALIGGGILFIVLGQLKSYPFICGGTFFLSLVNEAFRPANQTAIALFSTAENRTRSFSLSRLAINLGWAAGGALGGFLAAKNYTLLFWVDGITNLAAALLLVFLLPHSKTRITANKNKIGERPVPAASAYNDKPFMIFICFLAIFAICFFQSFSTLPVFYKQEWKLTEAMIGYVLAFNGLVITLVEMPFVKYAESRMQPLNCIVVGTFITACSFIVLNILPPSVLSAFISISLFTVGEIVAMPFMNTYWTSRSNDANRGEYASVYTTAFSMAHVTGPYSGAQLAQHRGFGMLWWVTGIVCAGAAAGFRYLKKKSK
jgi:predicted MFS family arabinose efflux permease